LDVVDFVNTCALPFRMNELDAELAGRTTPAEWDRILVLRDHPNFLRGLARYGELMPPYFANNVILNKVVTEAWRFEMLVYTLYLHDIRDPADASTGLTSTNLQRICAEQKCASRGRVLAILGLMQISGYLRRVRAETDRRTVHLIPSEAFIGIVEGWNNRIFRIIDAIVPEGALAHRHNSGPRFGWDMRRRGAEALLAGWKLLDPFPEVEHFVTRDGGWMLLLSCVAEALRRGEGTHIAPVSVDLKAFGARFGVSRSHLRRLLESAFDAGLLEAPPRNGAHVLLSRRLVAAFIACMASELGNYRLWALAANQPGDHSASRRGTGLKPRRAGNQPMLGM
jgi:hypothetical protein